MSLNDNKLNSMAFLWLFHQAYFASHILQLFIVLFACYKKKLYNNKRNKINFLWWQFLIYFFSGSHFVDLTTQCLFFCAFVHNFYEWMTLALMEMTMDENNGELAHKLLMFLYSLLRILQIFFFIFFVWGFSMRDKWAICFEAFLDWLQCFVN